MRHLTLISLLVFIIIAGYATFTGHLCEISLPIFGELRINCGEENNLTNKDRL